MERLKRVMRRKELMLLLAMHLATAQIELRGNPFCILQSTNTTNGIFISYLHWTHQFKCKYQMVVH